MNKQTAKRNALALATLRRSLLDALTTTDITVAYCDGDPRVREAYDRVSDAMDGVKTAIEAILAAHPEIRDEGE